MTSLTTDPQPEPIVPADSNINIQPHHNYPKAVILGIILFIILATTAYGAYWYGKNVYVTRQLSLSTTQPSNQTQTSWEEVPDTSIASPSASEIINWKTYTEVGQFSFKYPDGYVVHRDSEVPQNTISLGILSDEENKCLDGTKKCIAMGAALGILHINIENNRSITDLLTWLKNNSPIKDIKSVRTDLLGEGYSYSFDGTGPILYEITFYDKKSQKMVSFLDLSSPIREGDKAYQILSTFKFL